MTSDINLASLREYDHLRILYGIPEGMPTVDRLPLNLNHHLLNGISFDKGCYIGQENVARHFYRGQRRNICYPFVIGHEGQAKSINAPLHLIDPKLKIPEDTKYIYNEELDKVGRIMELVDNIGLAMFKVELLQDSGMQFLEDGTPLSIWRPVWMDSNDEKEAS